MADSRGNCSVCRYRYRLLISGRLAKHYIYHGNVGRVCAGSHKPTRLEWVDARFGQEPDCDPCRAYLSRDHMVGAAASVGIEHGMTTGQMLRTLAEQYHANGHEVRR